MPLHQFVNSDAQVPLTPREGPCRTAPPLCHRTSASRPRTAPCLSAPACLAPLCPARDAACFWGQAVMAMDSVGDLDVISAYRDGSIKLWRF